MTVKSLFLFVAVVCLIGAGFSVAPGAAAPALPGEHCPLEPEQDWDEPERWAWNEICEGRVADFNIRFGLSGPLDPKLAEGWDASRRIGQNFLETILLHEPFRSAIPRQGMRIAGAWIPDWIDLRNADVDHVVWLNDSRFEQGLYLLGAHFHKALSFGGSGIYGALEMTGLKVGNDLFMSGRAEFVEVVLRDAKVGGNLDMTGAKVSGKLDMDSLEVGSGLFMGNGAEFADVNLVVAKVGGNLDLTGAQASGDLIMDSLEVGNSLFMRGTEEFSSEFENVNLRGAVIRGQVDISGAKVSKTLDMDEIHVNSGLFMRNGAEFAKVILVVAKIGGNLDMTGAKVSGELIMDSLEVGNSLFMGGTAEFMGNTDLIFADIGANLDLSGASLTHFDASGSKIGELRLGSGIHPPARWRDGGSLVLRNTKVDAFQDRLEPDSWPLQIELDGFEYKRLGGFAGTTTEADVISRPASWFIEWLARDESYSAQPYRQLAGVLRAAGENGKANAVLYAGWEQQRKQAESSAHWLALSLLKYTIGYGLGYRYFWSLFWVGGFILIGVLVLARSDTLRTHGLSWTFACSLDILLPIVKLNESHAKFVQQLDGWPAYYFYAHQLAGWVLASFLIAGLSGLTEL